MSVRDIVHGSAVGTCVGRALLSKLAVPDLVELAEGLVAMYTEVQVRLVAGS